MVDQILGTFRCAYYVYVKVANWLGYYICWSNSGACPTYATTLSPTRQQLVDLTGSEILLKAAGYNILICKKETFSLDLGLFMEIGLDCHFHGEWSWLALFILQNPFKGIHVLCICIGMCIHIPTFVTLWEVC